MTKEYNVYFPDDGESKDDARRVYSRPWRTIYDAEDAAIAACELDFSHRDGWERGMESYFPIVVIAPDGTETRWKAWSEASVTHKAEPEDETQ